MASVHHKQPNPKFTVLRQSCQHSIRVLMFGFFLWNMQLCLIYNVKINISNQIFFAQNFTRNEDMSFTETKYDPA